MKRCVVTAWALLVLSLVASSAGAQERSLEIVEGKTTNAEIRAFYGPPDYWNEHGDLIYHASELKPPLPAGLRTRSLHQVMVIFELDDRGILLRYLTTGWPSP